MLEIAFNYIKVPECVHCKSESAVFIEKNSSGYFLNFALQILCSSGKRVKAFVCTSIDLRRPCKTVVHAQLETKSNYT